LAKEAFVVLSRFKERYKEKSDTKDHIEITEMPQEKQDHM